jgi:hypothetical protein
MSDLYAAERETAALRTQAALVHAATNTDDTATDEAHLAADRIKTRKALEELKMSKQMWVDKYRPRRFADLLGEDVRFDSF